MAGLFGRLVQYARSPQGKQMVNKAEQEAKRLAKDPSTRAKLAAVRKNFGTKK